MFFERLCFASKTKSEQQQPVMLLEMSLERRDIFNNAVGSTQKAGKLVKTLLNYVNFYSSVGSDRVFLTSKLPTLKDLIVLIFIAVLDNTGH